MAESVGSVTFILKDDTFKTKLANAIKAAEPKIRSIIQKAVEKATVELRLSAVP